MVHTDLSLRLALLPLLTMLACLIAGSLWLDAGRSLPIVGHARRSLRRRHHRHPARGTVRQHRTRQPLFSCSLAPQNLSRCLEGATTIIEPIMPWTVVAVFIASTVGVLTVEYLPWAIFSFSGPLFWRGYGVLGRWTSFEIARIPLPVHPR